MRDVGISAVLIGALALGGCGGGGGGGGGGSVPGTVTLAPTTLTFTTNSLAQTPASQLVSATINTNASGTLYLRIVSVGPAVADVNSILITGPTTGQGTVVPAAAATLGPGSHTSTITVTACTSGPACSSGIIGSPQTVSVIYNVIGVTSPSSAVSYELSLTPTAADYTRTLPVVAYPTFTATSSADWLSVAPTSGGSGTSNLAVNLVQSAVDAFESGDHTATVALTAAGGNSLQVPVTLTVAKPQIDQVAPYVAEANKSTTVIVRGLYLDRVPVSGFDLSSTPTGSGIAPTNITVVSPTELRLTHPALSAGSYFVRMHDAQGALIDRSTARLVVIEPTSYAARALSWPADMRLRNVQSLVYDDERKTLLIAVRYSGEGGDTELIRYQYTTDWSAPLITSFPYLDQLALSTDGRDLIASSSPAFDRVSKLSLLAPTSLAERASVRTADQTYFNGLAVLNTNDVIAQADSRNASGPEWPAYRYSVKRNAVTRLTLENASGFMRGTIVASRDGQRVAAGSQEGSSANQSIHDYDAGSSDVMMRLAPVRYDVRAMSMDRTGDKLLVRGHDISSEFTKVYDRSWNILGTISELVGDFYELGPDGTRAYIYGYDGDVHIYDVTATVAGKFPEIGTLTLAGVPDPGNNLMRMTISQDGHTLFIAGPAMVVVQPLP